MICEKCGRTYVRVIDSRPTRGGRSIRRRRRCACGHTFTTYEIRNDTHLARRMAYVATAAEAAVQRLSELRILARQVDDFDRMFEDEEACDVVGTA